MALPHHSLEGQPGLEVMDQPALEVVNNQQHVSSYYDQSLPQVASSEYIHSAKEAATPYSYAYSVDPEHYPSPGSHPHSTPATPSTAGKSRKRLWLIIGGVIAVLVILGAVLGGVFGSRAANSSSTDTSASQGDQNSGSNGGNNSGTGGNNSGSSGGSDTADDPAPKNTTTTTPIRKGSGLAVTGWRKPDGSSDTYLFFQDQKDELQYVRCDKSLRTTDKESTCWAEPVKINSYAIAGSRLAASTIIWGDFYQPMVELFYTGVKSRLLGVSLNDQETPNVHEDSVNDMDIYTGLGSNLGAYWPWTLYQDGAGTLHHVRNLLSGGTFRPTSQWDNNELDIAPAAYSRLAIVPTATDFATIAVKPGYAVFYQDKTSSKLAVHITDLNHPNRSATFHQPWPTTLPDIVLPAQAPIAAFSVARAGDTDRRVDTYVLYLGGGDSGQISVLYTDSAAGSGSEGDDVAWKTAAPVALRGADKDTDIACLTMGSSPYNAAEKAVGVEEAREERRCFFQRGGKVVEVRLDGSGGGGGVDCGGRGADSVVNWFGGGSGIMYLMVLFVLYHIWRGLLVFCMGERIIGGVYFGWTKEALDHTTRRIVKALKRVSPGKFWVRLTALSNQTRQCLGWLGRMLTSVANSACHYLSKFSDRLRITYWIGLHPYSAALFLQGYFILFITGLLLGVLDCYFGGIDGMGFAVATEVICIILQGALISATEVILLNPGVLRLIV